MDQEELARLSPSQVSGDSSDAVLNGGHANPPAQLDSEREKLLELIKCLQTPTRHQSSTVDGNGLHASEELPQLHYAHLQQDMDPFQKISKEPKTTDSLAASLSHVPSTGTDYTDDMLPLIWQRQFERSSKPNNLPPMHHEQPTQSDTAIGMLDHCYTQNQAPYPRPQLSVSTGAMNPAAMGPDMTGFNEHSQIELAHMANNEELTNQKLLALILQGEGLKTQTAPSTLGTNQLQYLSAYHQLNSMHTNPSGSLYKTELCRTWTQINSCRYGSKCQFAHGEKEKRPISRHPKYKTELCRTFSRTGVCPYGVRCRFIHSQSGYNWGLGLPNTILPDPYLTYNGVSSPESATSSTHGLGMYGGNLIPENLNPGLTHQSVPAGYDPTLSPYAQYLLATEGATLPRGARERNVGTQANTPGLYNGTQANYSPGLSNYNADLLAEGHLGSTGGKTWDNPQNAALEQTLQNLSVWSLQNPSQPVNAPTRSNILQPYSFEGDVNPGNRVQQPVQNYMPITREGHSDVTPQFLQQDNRSRPGLGEWHGGL